METDFSKTLELLKLKRELAQREVRKSPVEADALTRKGLEELRAAHDEEVLTQLRDDHKTRKKLTQSVFRVTVSWLVIVVIVVFFQAYKLGGFTLSDGVLIALLSGTTASVIGVFTIVAKYFFDRPAAHKPPR